MPRLRECGVFAELTPDTTIVSEVSEHVSKCDCNAIKAAFTNLLACHLIRHRSRQCCHFLGSTRFARISRDILVVVICIRQKLRWSGYDNRGCWYRWGVFLSKNNFSFVRDNGIVAELPPDTTVIGASTVEHVCDCRACIGGFTNLLAAQLTLNSSRQTKNFWCTIFARISINADVFVIYICTCQRNCKKYSYDL